MINHYINLAVWREIYPSYQQQTDKYWCDSVSLYFLSLLFVRNIVWIPGTSVIPDMVEDIERNDCLFLTSKSYGTKTVATVLPLPIFKSCVYLPKIINELEQKKFKKIYIGISSPNQNKLAIDLQKIFPTAEIFCLGAAVDMVISDQLDLKINKIISGSGLEWFHLFIKNPQRGYRKVYATFHEMFKIIFSGRHRTDFSNFTKILEKKL